MPRALANAFVRAKTPRGLILLVALILTFSGACGVWARWSKYSNQQTQTYQIALMVFTTWASASGFFFDMPTLSLIAAVFWTELVDHLTRVANQPGTPKAAFGVAFTGTFAVLFCSIPIPSPRPKINMTEVRFIVAAVLCGVQIFGALLHWAGGVVYMLGFWVGILYLLSTIFLWDMGILASLVGAIHAIPYLLPIPDNCSQAMNLMVSDCSAAVSLGMIFSWLGMVAIVVREAVGYIKNTGENLRAQIPPQRPFSPSLEEPLTGRGDGVFGDDLDILTRHIPQATAPAQHAAPHPTQQVNQYTHAGLTQFQDPQQNVPPPYTQPNVVTEQQRYAQPQQYMQY